MTTHQKIIEAMLKHHHFPGWKISLATEEAKKLGLRNEFQNTSELIQGYMQYVELLLFNRLEGADAQKLRISEKVQLAVETRLAIISQWREAELQAIQSSNLPDKLFEVADLADKIWVWAGDQSTDYNFYTKRLILGGIITSSTIYWMSDKSENFQDTREFIRNRIADTAIIGAVKQEISEHLKDLRPIFKALKDTYFN